MADYILTPRVRLELIQIGFDMQELVSAEKADEILLEIESKFDLLAANPYLGRERSEIQFGLRSFPVIRFPYVIFYQVLDNDLVKFIHVLHSSRDWGEAFR